jgi:hypothetical protein
MDVGGYTCAATDLHLRDFPTESLVSVRRAEESVRAESEGRDPGSHDEHVSRQAVLSSAGVVYSWPGSSEFHQPLALFTFAGLVHALEVALCSRPGLVDSGEHLLAVANKL